MAFWNKKEKESPKNDVIDYGGQKNDGGHDHRTNRQEDRTPAQKEGDKKRRKS
ncbi:hypothetical protein [Campylobacter ureolyticus]|uniref:Uncharacterized protein n=1 Tax=Campylobacter ureolyticus TaxID=827 RepID=A0AAE7E8T6_9BACT|nr:hypothetical protein [Campylobacter ureolyticus]MCR8684924.1 hypothetical protein [Campylobacter ureolyticus]QKF83720.1 hypothetical protein CURT_0191 [Campylobacter ureolyticus]QQY36123.1 hypothetical protein I6I59_02480 [Campylobacter ureolyticus]SUX24931.1 Uncharacterised protein [Campylobacter ureolyticus]